MHVFIDFDDVILNTKDFSLELRNFFEQHGVNPELFKKHYYDPKDDNQIKLFDPNGVFDRLEEYEKIETSELRANFEQFTQDLGRFLFKDVADFLSFVGKENSYLISFGLPDFQNKKIIGSGTDKLISGCIVTRGSKAQAIQQVMEKLKLDTSEPLVFIDDRVEQIQDIKKTFPKALTFFLRRSEGRYCDQKNEYCDYEIHNLKEAQKIIESYF